MLQDLRREGAADEKQADMRLRPSGIENWGAELQSEGWGAGREGRGAGIPSLGIRVCRRDGKRESEGRCAGRWVVQRT